LANDHGDYNEDNNVDMHSFTIRINDMKTKQQFWFGNH